MKKFLITISLMLISPFANATWHIDADDGCALFTRFMAKDDYYFCGAHDMRCHGDRVENSEIKKGNVKWYNEGDYQQLKNERYWCCGGKVTYKSTDKNTPSRGTAGKWVKGADFWDNSKTITRTEIINGGECTYTVKFNICGDEDDSDKEKCKNQAVENIKCPDGQYVRETNGKCAEVCPSGYAYESSTSNRCVECSETGTRGVVWDINGKTTNEAVPPEHAICRKCDATTSIFDAKTKTCKQKQDPQQLRALSMSDLQYGINNRTRNSKSVSDQCWTKYGDEYKKCVLNQ